MWNNLPQAPQRKLANALSSAPEGGHLQEAWFKNQLHVVPQL